MKAQPAPDRKAKANRLLQQGIEQLKISQFRETLQAWQEVCPLTEVKLNRAIAEFQALLQIPTSNL